MITLKMRIRRGKITLKGNTCPSCGTVMEGGYVYSTRQIMWSEVEEENAVHIDDEELVGLTIFKPKKLKASRCKSCQFVSFYYERFFE